MFKVLTSTTRKRRIWSPATVAVSVGAHALLIGGALYAVAEKPRPRVEKQPQLTWIETLPKRLDPVQPEQPRLRTAPRAPAATQPSAVIPDPPTVVPTTLPTFDPAESPLPASPVTVGTPTGGTPNGDPSAPATPGDPGVGSPVGGDGVYQPEAVQERPVLRNAAEVQRMMQRLYPPLLQDAGVSGKAVLQFVVDARGEVEPGSITVVSVTHEGFAEPSVKAAERFRFRPAKVGGRAVRVLISMPVQWTLDQP
ncbi:MAG: TonB family protein [Gemmatimonadetes bacterium]|nr:TonB family protein [Gemmatimonadota bacterium]